MPKPYNLIAFTVVQFSIVRINTGSRKDDSQVLNTDVTHGIHRDNSYARAVRTPRNSSVRTRPTNPKKYRDLHPRTLRLGSRFQTKNRPAGPLAFTVFLHGPDRSHRQRTNRQRYSLHK